MHLHWINRNYTYTADKRKYTGSIVRHGEVHWRYDATDAGYARNSHTGSFSWNWGQTFCGLECTLGGGDGNNEIELFLGLPWVLSLWLHHTLPPWIVQRLPQHHYSFTAYHQDGTLWCCEGSYPEKRSTGVRVHHWTLWWNVWHNDDEWCSTDPWYRRGSFNLPDAILGSRDYLQENLGPPIHTHVQMREGQYPVTVQHQREHWWRARWKGWPCRITRSSWHVECDVGIPFPGKGENAWDCGEDALHGASFAVSTGEEACDRFRATVLEYRRRYGGQRCADAPWPQSAADRRREVDARRAARQGEQTVEDAP